MAEPPLINKSSPSSSSSLPPPTSPPSFSSNAVSAAIAAAVLPTTMEGNGGWGNNNNDINETSPPSYASATANNNNNNNNTLPPPSSSIPSYYIPSSPSPHHTRIPSPLPLTHTTSAMSPPLPTATSMVAGTSDCKGTICGCSGCRYCVSKPDFAYLFSWPLVGQIGNEPPFVIKKLDFDAEWQLFKKTLDSARRSIAIRSETATSENLRQVINLGARAVHYTGHGLPTCLAFEDGQGRMHSLDAPTLKALVGAGGGAVGVKFVFVSACHSEIAGQAFVDAGVPHVIAVRLDAQVADRASRTFMSQFYSALLCGKTVQAAYEIGKAAVKADPLITRSDEPKKFLLLPDNGDHNVAIFDAATTPTGGWIDVSPEPKLYSIPNCPESFLGRQKEMQQVVALLAKKKFISVVGEVGIGKTLLSIAVSRYVLVRNFFDAIYFVPLASIKSDPYKSIAHAVYSEIKNTTEYPSLSIDPIDCESLCAALKRRIDRRYLFVFDGADLLLGESIDSPRCIRSFISQLLKHIPKCVILVTSRQPIGFLSGVMENVVKIEPLSPEDAAQLFHDLRTRDIQFSEFSCSDSKNAKTALASHPALRYLEGHPRRIFFASQLLRDTKHLNDLLPLIKEWEQKNPEKLDPELLFNYNNNNNNNNTTNTTILPPPPLLMTSSIPPSLSSSSSSSSSSIDPASIHQWRSWFSSDDNVKWLDLQTKLMEAFVISTGQNERVLEASDWALIKKKLGNNDTVHISSFQSFYSWWKALCSVIFIIRDYWLTVRPVRIIHGIMTRQSSEDILAGQNVGCFLIRFSETQIGRLSIDYIADSRPSYSHLLVECSNDGTFKIYLKTGDTVAPKIFHSLSELVIKLKPLVALFPSYPKESLFVL